MKIEYQEMYCPVGHAEYICKAGERAPFDEHRCDVCNSVLVDKPVRQINVSVLVNQTIGRGNCVTSTSSAR